MQNMLSEILKQYHKWKPLTATKNILYHFMTRERKRSYGSLNPDITFYVIRSINSDSPFYIGPIHNLLANYFYVLSHLQYAKLKGYVPVVDQQNYPVYNSLPYPIHGTVNAWEYFWKQPCGIPLEEVYKSKNVVLSQQSWYWQWDMGYDIANYTDMQIVSRFCQLADEVPINALTEQYVQQTKAQVIKQGEKVLGVAYRYGGHAKGSVQGQGHPISPETNDLLAITERHFREWEMQKVFLASDEVTIVDCFRAVFGDNLTVLTRDRREANRQYDPQHPNPMYEEKNQYRTALEYLTEMEILSSCDALIGSVNSGLRYAVVRNNGKYRYVDILDRGRFKDMRKVTDKR